MSSSATARHGYSHVQEEGRKHRKKGKTKKKRKRKGKKERKIEKNWRKM